MRALIFAPLLALAACAVPAETTAPISSSIPGASTVCAQISTDRLDVAWRGYDVAIDAVNLLIDSKVIVPGSAKAKALADVNDKVLAAFTTAEQARALCNATSYSSALDQAKAALAEMRTVIGSK